MNVADEMAKDYITEVLYPWRSPDKSPDISTECDSDGNMSVVCSIN